MSRVRIASQGKRFPVGAPKLKIRHFHDNITILSLTLCACGVSAVCLPASAATVMNFTQEIAVSLSENDDSHPNSVSIDPTSGELCVTNAGRKSIQVYHPQGVLSFETSTLAKLGCGVSSVPKASLTAACSPKP